MARRFFGVVFVSALAIGVSIVAIQAAGAMGTGPRSGTPVGTGVAHQVSAADQRDALAYWTPARMAAARSAALPQTGANGTAVGAPKGTPTAVHYNGVPTIGALFYTTSSGASTQQHYCTASVVDSTGGDLVLTAAHCVYSNRFVTNIEYVPEFHSGVLPYGAWAVRAITVASGWINSHNPNLDYAFLTVSSPAGGKIQTVTGGLKPGFTLWYQQTIEVAGYNNPDSQPIRCLTKSFKFRLGQMEFYCHGFWTGTSGSPWIIGYNAKTGTGTVFGVIGGYEEGGKYEWASYSSYFGPSFRLLYERAETA